MILVKKGGAVCAERNVRSVSKCCFAFTHHLWTFPWRLHVARALLGAFAERSTSRSCVVVLVRLGGFDWTFQQKCTVVFLNRPCALVHRLCSCALAMFGRLSTNASYESENCLVFSRLSQSKCVSKDRRLADSPPFSRDPTKNMAPGPMCNSERELRAP